MKKILFQFDTDAHSSSFDAVTALDAGIDHLLQYSHVNASNVVPLVQGGIFTRGPKDLHHTAIFVGGSDVETGEAVLEKVQECFFGPMRVSVMMDSNGCNTTAAAAVVYISRHLELTEVKAVILGGTGPVGRRVASILAAQGAEVTVCSRSLVKAQRICGQIQNVVHAPQAAEIPEDGQFQELLAGKNVLISTGAAGVEFLTLEEIQHSTELKLAFDLNAVPPLGIRGIESTDKARPVGNLHCYGAVGIGGLKMNIHHSLIREIFQDNQQVFDTLEIYQHAVKVGN